MILNQLQRIMSLSSSAIMLILTISFAVYSCERNGHGTVAASNSKTKTNPKNRPLIWLGQFPRHFGEISFLTNKQLDIAKAYFDYQIRNYLPRAIKINYYRPLFLHVENLELSEEFVKNFSGNPIQITSMENFSEGLGAIIAIFGCIRESSELAYIAGGEYVGRNRRSLSILSFRRKNGKWTYERKLWARVE